MLDFAYKPITTLPYLMVLADLLKGIAWPTAFIVVGYYFRPELRGLLGKVHKVSRDGIEFTHIEQKTNRPDHASAVAITDAPLKSRAAIIIEEENKKQLEVFAPAVREAVLLRSLTLQQLQKFFALAYGNIFGSQIQLMKDLSQKPLPREVVENYVDEQKAIHPELRDWPLDQYLHFLFQWEFIEFHEGIYRLTDTGGLFLLFLAQHNLSEKRWF